MKTTLLGNTGQAINIAKLIDDMPEEIPIKHEQFLPLEGCFRAEDWKTLTGGRD
ncbi:hypothetical protein IRP16_004167 [Salmonella enterica]|nr:hypothetical protein [Salmonella enterica]EGM2363790.1 hypothetical protein [Salmonella enterica]